jgi:hypothetical protein
MQGCDGTVRVMSKPGDRPSKDALRQVYVNRGFSPPTLERIGVLMLGCAQFETELEKVFWQMDGWPEVGSRPRTDGWPISRLLEEFRRAAIAAHPEFQRAVENFLAAAGDVIAFRNAIAHGEALALPRLGTAVAISNGGVHGVQRKRPAENAHLDASIFDMVLDALFLLMQAIYAGHWQAQEFMRLPALLQSPGLNTARSLANEARNIASLVNHEKY